MKEKEPKKCAKCDKEAGDHRFCYDLTRAGKYKFEYFCLDCSPHDKDIEFED